MPPPTDRIRLVQVGAGAMGRPGSTSSPGRPTWSSSVWLDLDLDDRAALRCRTPACPTSRSPRTLAELLDRVEADAVVNVTSRGPCRGQHHGAAARARGAVRETAGRHLAAALSMIAAAEVGGRLLMVSQSRRYWRNLDALRGQIAQLGRLGLVACSFFKAPHFGGFREQMAYPLLKDMAIHQFDLARDLIGSEPVSVYCESFNPTWSWYAGDAAAKVNCRVRATVPGSCSPAAGAVPAWRRPGTAAGGSAGPTAQRSGTVTTHRSRRPPTASRSPP